MSPLRFVTTFHVRFPGNYFVIVFVVIVVVDDDVVVLVVFVSRKTLICVSFFKIHTI